MSTTRTHVIVGAGMAGAHAARTLREEGFDGRIVLIGAEDAHPYERPPLSKQFLRGETTADAARLNPTSFYTEHDIELRVGTRVTELSDDRDEVLLHDGERISFDRLLLATGARPRRLAGMGSHLPGIHYLRTVGDAATLRAAIRSASRVAVVGAGWIGTEVAASARQMGREVALIAPEPIPLVSTLGEEVGGIYRDLHAQHGVELHMGTAVKGFVGTDRVAGVATHDGGTIAADLVVVGVGAEPRAELAASAGLDVDGAIVVNEFLQTSRAGVFAAGDVAAAWHPHHGRHIRVEHWANAKHQGVTAARNMLGRWEPHLRIPYFFSDQYELGMEYSGYAPVWDDVVFRGDPASLAFIAFWTRRGRVVAAMNAGVWDVVGELQSLIASRVVVDPRRLSDPTVPLDGLAVRV